MTKPVDRKKSQNYLTKAEDQPDFTSQEEAKNSIKWAERILAQAKNN